MLAAILCCSLMMTSCIDEMGNSDNPSSDPELELTDKTKWWLDENFMDKSVNPGDNFYMYCVGTWWKNTAIPTLSLSGYISRFETDGRPIFSDKVRSLTDANFQKFQSRLEWAEDGSEAAKAGQKAYDNMLAESGMNSAATSADVLKAFGKMGAMGVATCLRLEPFSVNGKVCLLVEYDVLESNVGDGEVESARQMSLRKMIKKDPDVMAHLVPLGSKGGTRAIPEKYSVIKSILEGMGFNPEDAYTLEDYAKALNMSDDESTKQNIANWKKGFESLQNYIQNETLDNLKNMLLEYYKVDYGFISKATMEACNKQLEQAKSGKVLSLSALESTMDNKYLPYLRSKMVADQLVPAGLKEDYLRHCRELKAVFAQRIKDNDWLSDGSKQNALEKLENMTFNVAYPDKWIKAGLADFSKNKSLVEDIYTLRKARIDLLKAIVGKKSSTRATC